MTIANPHFESSYQRLFEGAGDAGADRFFALFYRLFKAEPGVSELFAQTDTAQQVHMLKRSVYDLVGFYVTGTPSAELHRLAQLHADLGISTVLLDCWLHALLNTVEQLDPEVDELTLLGWTCAMLPGVTMIRLALRP